MICLYAEYEMIIALFMMWGPHSLWACLNSESKTFLQFIHEGKLKMNM